MISTPFVWNAPIVLEDPGVQFIQIGEGELHVVVGVVAGLCSGLSTVFHVDVQREVIHRAVR